MNELIEYNRENNNLTKEQQGNFHWTMTTLLNDDNIEKFFDLLHDLEIIKHDGTLNFESENCGSNFTEDKI
jgi:hypothetical protein